MSRRAGPSSHWRRWSAFARSCGLVAAPPEEDSAPARSGRCGADGASSHAGPQRAPRGRPPVPDGPKQTTSA
eukprot:4535823-Prymnesium_polylepis.1